jgi:hypothetical protein
VSFGFFGPRIPNITEVRVMASSSSLRLLGAAAFLFAIVSGLPAQEAGCFGLPGSLGAVDLDGGSANVGGFSLTADGLTLYYDSWLSGAGTGWVMTARRERGKRFDGGERLGPTVNTGGATYGPRISADGRMLYFAASGRAGGHGRWDIWVATKGEGDDADAFTVASPLPAPVNTAGAEFAGCVSPDGSELFFTRGSSLSDLKLWVAHFEEPHEPLVGFSDARPLTELHGSESVLLATMSPDGQYLIWSDRPPGWPQGVPVRPGGHGGSDLWMAVRPSVDAAFGPPINLPAPPNSDGNDLCPWVWPGLNGDTLLLYSQQSSVVAAVPIIFGDEIETRARFSISGMLAAGVDVLLDAGASTPAAAIERFEWSIGLENAHPRRRDGVEGETVTYRFPSPGRYQVTLVVSTNDGSCDYESQLVDVAEATRFRRGDSNGDETVNIADSQHLLNFLFLGGPQSPCEDAADANDDGRLNIADAQYLLNSLFLGGPEPPAPGADPGDCGPDPITAEDRLGCDSGAELCP